MRFVLFTLAVGVAAINTGNNLFYLLVAMMLSLITMSGLLSELCLRNLRLSCHAPEFAYVGTDATLTLALSNPRRRFPSFSLRITHVIGGRASDRQVHVKYLPTGGTVLVSYPIHLDRRGRYDIDGLQIATPFPFGLFLKRSFLPQPMSVVGLPKPEPLPTEILADVLAIGSDRSAPRKGPGVELYNLRLYQPGDDSRLIHWMSTARTAQLIVRETEADQHPRVTIWLSTTVPPDAHGTLERAVALAASLIAQFLARGFRVRSQVGKLMAVSDGGEEDLPRLLTPLALCAPVWPEEPWSEADEPCADPEWPMSEEPVLAVVPWSSPTVRAQTARATKVIDTFDEPQMGGMDGTGASLPA